MLMEGIYLETIQLLLEYLWSKGNLRGRNHWIGAVASHVSDGCSVGWHELLRHLVVGNCATRHERLRQ